MSADVLYDFVIVGAGVVGPALAKALADHGKSVLILERDLRQPDRIVGELLQPGGVQTLKKLGMAQALEGIDAAPIYGYEVIYNGDCVDIPYPRASPDEKPAQGRGFHHGRFVQNLRQIARETKGVTLVQGSVIDIVQTDGRVTGVETREHGVFSGRIVCVCDGTSSKFRKNFVDTQPIVESFFVGAILQHPKLLVPNHGHVIIGSTFSPILVYQTSQTEARILCNVPLKKLPSVANGDLRRWLETNCLPNVPAGIKPSFAKALEEGKLRSMPNQYLPAVKYDVPGLVLLGDAMNMRHPLTGGGMTVGLGDAYLLSGDLGRLSSEELSDHTKVKPILKHFRQERKRSSVVVNVLSIALYQLFAAQSPELRILQRGCFGHFEMGGECVTGPVSLLSGIAKQPSTLFYHFFAVAFYAIKLNYVEKWRTMGALGVPVALYQTISTLYVASMVFLPFLIKELVL